MNRKLRVILAAGGISILASACTPEQIHLFEAQEHVDFTPAEEKALESYVPPTKHLPTSFVSGDGCGVAYNALLQAGATSWEASFGRNIARRESRCRLRATNFNRRTGDNSWGPWQINYYGSLYTSRANLVGPPASNTSSWVRAASNFLKLGRTAGWCHWRKPNYCA